MPVDVYSTCAASLSLVLVVVTSQWSVCWTHTGGHQHQTMSGDQPASFHDAKVVHDAEYAIDWIFVQVYLNYSICK